MPSLLDYMVRLTVTQGEGLGGPFPLFPWEKKFIRGAFATPGHACLTMGRGNGKTTLLGGLGPWKDSVYLIGGLVLRYLVPERPLGTLAHAGTSDVDIVVELEMLADTNACRPLEENLKRLGFERAENANGDKQS